MNGSRRLGIAFLSVLSVWSAVVPGTTADEVESPAYREIRLPADDLDEWLGRGTWRAMAPEEFEQLVGRAGNRQPPAPAAWCPSSA